VGGTARSRRSARAEITYPARLRRDGSNSVHDHTPELWRVSRVDALPAALGAPG